MGTVTDARQCRKCGVAKLLTEFRQPIEKNGRPYSEHVCKQCRDTAKKRADVVAYQARKGDGKCGHCGADPVPGRSHCEGCRARATDERIARIAKGACGQCGGVRDSTRRLLCSKCDDVARRRRADRRKRLREAGLCDMCGSSAAVAREFCLPCWFKVVAQGRLGDTKRAGELRALWDAQGGLCAMTGRPLIPGKGASLDHITPKSRGGTHDVANLRWVVNAVNIAKSTLSDHEFLDLCRCIVATADARSPHV